MNIIKKKKIATTQLLRHIIQLVAFILFPGLFISTFAAIRDVYTALINGSFSLSAQAESLLVLLAVSQLQFYGEDFSADISALSAPWGIFYGHFPERCSKNR